MGWLQELFCGALNRELTNALNDLKKIENNLSICESELMKSKNQYNELNQEYEHQKNELNRLKSTYNDAIKALSNAIEIPDISMILSQAVNSGVEKKVDPPNEVNPVKNKMYGFIYDIETSDNIYYAYDHSTWKQILNLIQPLVKKVVGFGSSELADCDNYAYTTAVFTALAFNKAKKKYQGCIGVAEGYYDPSLSATHAFNVVFLNDNQMMTYEPYNNNWIGLTDVVNTQSLKYKVRKINFSN
jgi:hypothetical protein